MFMPGPFELIVIAAILLAFIGIPIAVVLIVFYVIRSNAKRPDK